MLIYKILLSNGERRRGSSFCFSNIISSLLSHKAIFVILLCLCQFNFNQVQGNANNENRYSFSLTTFSPSGKLQQVEYATRAATTLGSPIIAAILPTSSTLSKKDQILLCTQAPNSVLLNPLVNDDGTSRFCSICPGIAMAYTGINGDGRVVMAAAQRLAIEHEYTFDENIPIYILLEELSLLFQKYTRSPGSRPFGCCVLVADCNSGIPTFDSSSNEKNATTASLYLIGPSGAVECIGSNTGTLVVIGDGVEEKEIQSFLDENQILEKSENDAIKLLIESIYRNIRKKMEDKRSKIASVSKINLKDRPRLSFITASLKRNEDLITKLQHNVNDDE